MDVVSDIEVNRFLAMLRTLDEKLFEHGLFEQFIAIENGWAEAPWENWPAAPPRPIPKTLRGRLHFGDAAQIAEIKRLGGGSGEA